MMFIIRFQELLNETKTTKSQVALKTNIPLQTICNWFDRGSLPTADKLIKLADYFEVSTDYLLGRSNDVGVIETNANLTTFQSKLLAVVAALPRDDQFQVLGFAQALAK